MFIHYLFFLKTYTEPQTGVIWEKNTKYKITYEDKDTYYLGVQNGVKCGIDKSLEGSAYKKGSIELQK